MELPQPIRQSLKDGVMSLLQRAVSKLYSFLLLHSQGTKQYAFDHISSFCNSFGLIPAAVAGFFKALCDISQAVIISCAWECGFFCKQAKSFEI